MSANLLRSLADDKPNLRKQRGCRTGIYQHSNPNYLVEGGQISRKRLPSVFPDFSCSNHQHAPKGLYTRRDVDDKQRVSVESPRASYSSTCLSSSSSLDSAQMEQVEVSTLDQIILPEASSRNSTKNWPGAHFQDVPDDSKRNSVRSFRLEKPINGPSDLKESLSVLARLRELPSYFDERDEVLLSSYESACLAPRLSYDGREPGRSSSESRETITKLKNLPRLSLDSRERAILGSNSMLKSQAADLLEKKGEVNYITRSCGSQKRPPNVVAKLMGLEALPDPVKPNKISDSAGMPKMEAKSPSWKLHDSSPKTISGSRFLIESAPWKQQIGRNEVPQKSLGSNPVNVPTRQSEPSSPVYGEIERRLKDLESKQSGKDLRALKQKLEAMQAKGFLVSERGEECPMNSEDKARYMSSDQNLKLEKYCSPRSNHVFSSAKQQSDHLTNIDPTIVIMKPATLVGGVGSGTRTLKSRVVNNDGMAKNKSPRNGSIVSLRHINKRSNGQGLISKECSVNPVKSSSSLSPRLQHKLELEKKDPSTRQSLAQKITSAAKLEPGLPNFSSGLGSNTFRESNTRSKINYQNLSLKSSRQRTRRISEEDGLTSEEAISLSTLVQHHSPVSVLDMSESPDDSSPVEHARNSLGEYSDCGHEVQGEAGSSLGFNRKKLQNVERLVQKLKRLNSTHDEESTDYIALLCENQNPEHRYISEILVASGILLRDLSSGLSTFQLHPSGHPINPDLFLVLERRKTRNGTVSKEDKSHRRLTFDAVNEILARKFVDTGVLRDKLVEETLTAQKLLKEMCGEIELLEAKAKRPRSGSIVEDDGCLRSILWEDVMRSKDKWTGSCGETYDMVRELEQMILEGLFDEIGIRGKVSLRTSSRSQPQQGAGL